MEPQKKIAIMQPYFFPFIGYYQLVFASDYFISYNDVNFIEGGWINRNYIISPGEKSLITVPLVKPSPNRLINEIKILSDSSWKKKLEKTIFYTYKKAPFFDDVYHLVQNVINDDIETIDALALLSISKVFEYSGIAKNFYSSSQINYDRSSDRVGKILSIANYFESKTILFPSGSKELYRDEEFESHDFKSFVVAPQIMEYRQFVKDKFISHLSMIDVLMFNSPGKVKEMISNIKFEKLND
jgi:hypothetical protein